MGLLGLLLVVGVMISFYTMHNSEPDAPNDEDTNTDESESNKSSEV